jgi:hypothetical protein
MDDQTPSTETRTRAIKSLWKPLKKGEPCKIPRRIPVLYVGQTTDGPFTILGNVCSTLYFVLLLCNTLTGNSTGSYNIDALSTSKLHEQHQ